MASSSKRGPGFHHVAIRAFDFDKTIRFYTDGFGFSVRYSWGNDGERATMMDMGDGNYLDIFEGRGAANEIPEGGILHFALRVASCDDAYEAAISAGAMTVMEPADLVVDGAYPVTIRIGFVRGFDGEVIEFFENDEL